MNNLQLLRQNPRKVLESFKQGTIERMELSVEQITDDFMIYGIRIGMEWKWRKRLVAISLVKLTG